MLQGTSTLAFLVMPVECTIHATVKGVGHLFESTILGKNRTHVSDFGACRTLGQSAELPAAFSDAHHDCSVVKAVTKDWGSGKFISDLIRIDQSLEECGV
jgi:hypothetical protein